MSTSAGNYPGARSIAGPTRRTRSGPTSTSSSLCGTRVEHRYDKQQKTLGVVLAGHAQALLLNFEQEITSKFGVKYSLATRLRFPVFIGTFTEGGEKALKDLRKTLPAGLQRFIADYHSGLDSGIEQDHRFEFRLRVTLELAARDPKALAMQFTRFDDMSEEQKQAVEQMGKTGTVIIREQQRGVLNHGYLKASEARQRVADAIPFRFTQNAFTSCWKHHKVRPAGGDAHPERTREEFCVWDSTHQDYVYTDKYVTYLIKNLSTEDGYWDAVGREPLLNITHLGAQKAS